MVCFGYIIVNTMHKGDNKDDDYVYDNNDNNKCNLYCLHPVVLYDDAFNRVISFDLLNNIFIVLYYHVNIIIITVNDFLV
jgi:hypothetical protein